jgi:hypothetical protein
VEGYRAIENLWEPLYIRWWDSMPPARESQIS